ncbi:MAG: ABC transporter permease [Bryobacterales bacterium]|nr:ABC transporter permease [Bryobacterales bacterium]
MFQDVRYAFRALRRSWVFATAAVLSLALGIGATTAAFSLLDAVLLRQLPVPEPEQLVQIGPASAQGRPGPVSTLLLDALRDDPTVAGVCGFWTPLTTVQYGEAPVPVSTLVFTEDCFRTLGIVPALGRFFGSNESQNEFPNVAVISYDVWQREYAGSLDVLGKTLRIEGVPCTIIGVTEPRFSGLLLGFPAKVIFPMALHRRTAADGQPFSWVTGFLRRRPTATAGDMRAHLSVLWPKLLETTVPTNYAGEQREQYRRQKLVVVPASGGVDYTLRARFGGPLYILLGISALVLLFCCVNVANLMLARGVAREREIAVRLALGARRAVVIRQLTAESSILVIAGLAAGVAAAHAGIQLLLGVFRANYSAFDLKATPDGRVLLLSSAAATLALLIAGLVPAMRTSAVDNSTVVRGAGRSVAGGGRGRRWLVSTQVALTIILLSGAGLYAAVLRDLRTMDLGFQVSRLLTVQLALLPGGNLRGNPLDSYHRDLLRRVRLMPGVASACLSNTAPLFTRGIPGSVERPGGERAPVAVSQVVVSDSFFDSMGIPLLSGHDFWSGARPGDMADVIISKPLAENLFPDGTALGGYLRVRSGERSRNARIIGVAADARLFGPKAEPVLVAYLNYWQAPEYQMMPALLVRTTGHVESLADQLRRQIFSEGREYITYARTMEMQRDLQLVQERLLAALASTFALIALVLAAVGLFGLLTYLVSNRAPEIGIRIALGARPKTVIWLILREALVLTGMGIAAGIPVTIALLRGSSHFISASFVPGLVFLGGALVSVVVVTVLAALIPAHIASRLSAMEALRQQ